MGATTSVPIRVAFADASEESAVPLKPFTSRFTSPDSPTASTASTASTAPTSTSPTDATLSPTSSTPSSEPDTKPTESKKVTNAASAKPPQTWWQWLRSPSELPNPGAYDELGQESATILRPNLIEGLSFNFNAPLSEAFALGTALEAGAKDRPPVVAFNANYFTNRLVMISRTSPSDGRVHARIFYNHAPALTSKVVAEVTSEPDKSRLSYDLDYRSPASTTQLKFASGRLVGLSHFASVTSKLALGAEGLFQTRQGFAALTVAARHSDASRLATLSLASYGPVIASYVRKVNPKVSFATEMFIDGRTLESLLTAGYRFELTSGTVTGFVDSGGRLGATLEERINPALALTLSGELDHVNEQHNFGFGVNIGGG